MCTPIAPTEVRYIKLGDGGRWAKSALEEGYVAFGYHSIPHNVCEAKDWDEVRRLLDDRKSEGAKTAGVNEVMAFYEMGEDCLWVTLPTAIYGGASRKRRSFGWAALTTASHLGSVRQSMDGETATFTESRSRSPTSVRI